MLISDIKLMLRNRQIIAASCAGSPRSAYSGAHRYLPPDARDARLGQDGAPVRHGGGRGARVAGAPRRGAGSLRG